MRPYTIPFAQLGRHDVAEVGGKNSSLGEMIANLTSLGVTVPGGFATTAEAFRDFLSHEGLADRIAAVSAREVGGPHPGRGFDVVIDAVDEVFDDELFAGMGRGGLGARRGLPRLWRRVRPRPGRAPDTEDGPGW